MIQLSIFFVILMLTRAQVPSLGSCPDYIPMADFDIDSFLGKWYEAERYFQFMEVGSRCVITDYARGPSGKIYVSNEVTNRLTGVKRIIEGHLELSARAGEGKFTVKYNTSPLNTQAHLIVLGTDYDNYAVLWSCSGFGPIHTQSVWAMTRERLPANPVLQMIYGILDEYKISRNFFIKTDQEGCAIAASDINAANGITSISTIVESTGLPQRNTQTSSREIEEEQIRLADKGNSTDNDSNSNSHKTNIKQERHSVDINVETNKYATNLEMQRENVQPKSLVQDKLINQVKTIPFVSEPVKIELVKNPVISESGNIQNAWKTVLTVTEADIESKTVSENKEKTIEVGETLKNNRN
ncbi:apolipoprotein D-like [Diorhabda carinulata]|uniref:apolipoprotein D-like n=1 Tax=Diorhabda carinulata TaxID=1163345 RepID=UPI0025A0EB64|nr:apolipoprotein D-like [Diorhabda carinulata]